MTYYMDQQRREHPRPQFIRENWQSLDGSWSFCFDDEEQGISKNWQNGLQQSQEILVPFTYETKHSGIADSRHHSVVWYEKDFEVTTLQTTRIIFEGVDYACQIWLNGEHLGSHQGAYERFELPLTSLKKGQNKLVVRVEDSMACEQPRGKQRWQKDNFGCWYVQTTGIWKTVWLQTYQSPSVIENVKITPDIDRDKVIFEPIVTKNIPDGILEIQLSFDGKEINKYQGSFHHQMVPIEMDTRLQEDAHWGTREWHPEHPDLYDVTFKLYDNSHQLLDEVTSYFGMRKIEVKDGQILLNNRQLYQRLILDQGYWPDSGLTPPSVDALELDIDRTKELGYNGLRKHQKIEDERFLYLCDKKGMLVWSEMAATYDFNDLAIENFVSEWKKIVQQNYNHPSIITWVPFNESWGVRDIQHNRKQQLFTESIYYLTKALDNTRPVITNDGWEHTISDIVTLHDYEELGEVLKSRFGTKEDLLKDGQRYNQDRYMFADGYEYKGQPILISEFGGIAFSNTKEEQWGYGHKVNNEEEFLKRFSAIHEAIQSAPYIVGYCYTQLTDVEQEVNGLLDVDRKYKVDKDRIRTINEQRKQ